MNVEEEILALKERNQRVEADKAWETSLFRKLLVAATTYLVASIALIAIGSPQYYLGAVVPTLGYLLSTLTFPAIKRWWIRNHAQ